ncbi:threonylcarbamoyl-AMP synthase [Rhodococcus sp. AD45-ID]|uniref:L-threonylcarbamoyladenylate synthase n=1 Tax=unclassified Rhodococcus (in: high G+C Gram-positive bacteria) TaxID=192944 RepID=UPI0005D2DBB9|nr:MULTISPECIES: L-threonylcarbamoyladenylate synthase [unclassified Rhodococcus (in: high G+C Gram-positive bacteria)]KJF19450.1 t(6)A37 threonylcarbamoyladenosine biosynthesis protein RimN [Rhodococcus sp. AD45]PSR39409.1 threonylcarbamoyl-AMP synthase [Rhodococcus sp. AD45-ID]
MSTVYDCSEIDTRTAGLAAAKNALKAGRLVVLPTDTLYGLAADAFDSEAVTSLLRAKGRGRDMPVPVLVGSWNTIDGLVYSVRPQARDLVRAFWPGGLSLVVEQAPSLAWDLGDTRGTVMLRMPLHPVALELLRDVGPLAVSSANISGRPPATTVDEARDQLGGSASVYLDGGPAAHAVASTIVDLTADSPRILRVGAVSAEDIADVLGTTPESLVEGVS